MISHRACIPTAHSHLIFASIHGRTDVAAPTDRRYDGALCSSMLPCAAARHVRGPASRTRRALCGSGAGNSASGMKLEDIPVRRLYKDCMRLTYHIAARSAKGEAMRAMVRTQFKAQVHVEDEAEISRLKMLAVTGLQNYVIHESTQKATAQRERERETSKKE